MSRSQAVRPAPTVGSSNGEDTPTKQRPRAGPVPLPAKPIEVMPEEQPGSQPANAEPIVQTPAAPEAAPSKAEKPPPKTDPAQYFGRIAELAMSNAPQEQLLQAVVEAFEGIVLGSGLEAKYNLIHLHDLGRLSAYHADRVYRAVSEFKERKPILLTLSSRGGSIEAAYLIAKVCREYSDGAFSVAVPREAKSAATLLCFGAEKVHMGSISELGPIDPQINGVPALALKSSMEHMIELVKEHPTASEMIAKYLKEVLDVSQIGYFERVAESAVQYAERLLLSRKKPHSKAEAAKIAGRLVYEYKDHGFVIDGQEAIDIFGKDMVATNTEEYALANNIHQYVDLARFFIKDPWKGSLHITGSHRNGIWVLKQADTK